MLNVVKSDFYKLWKSKFFKGCVFASFIVAIIFVGALHTGVIHATVDGRGAAEMLAQIMFAGFYIYIFAVFTSLFVASEFQYGTIKNMLSRGAGRTKVFFSKVIVCISANLVMLAIFICTVLIVGTVLWGFDPNGIGAFSGLLAMIPLQAFMIIAYSILFTSTSIAIKGMVSAITVNLASLMIFTVLLNSVSALFSKSFTLADYWIGSSVMDLATLTPSAEDIVRGLIIAVAWSVMSATIGLLLFKKADVK